MSEHVFRRNLLALSGTSGRAAALLDAAERDPRMVVRRAASGAPVPVFLSGERELALHSLVDPVREGARVAAARSEGGFVVALGLGAGYGILPLLGSTATSGVMIVEYGAGLLRALLDELDLSELFLDGRVSLLLDPSPEELGAALLETYVPPVAGDLGVLPLKARVDLDPASFGAAADTVRALLGRISDDYSVQSFFGKLWFRNAARNLFAAESPAAPLAPVRRAVVTAAGPSLEEALPTIRAAVAAGDFLIATDTSLPALLGAGLAPGAVVSIDCQAISYYHFLKGVPPGTPLVIDLASPNRLARLGAPARFFSSGHPFCAFLSTRWRPFPALDTSGGNVTHAAISLAEALGAESALLAGADFSYPQGKSYARGTYIYDYFAQRASRLAPVESLFSGFVWRNASVTRETGVDDAGREYARYVTKPLMAYREHLERFAAASPLAIRAFRGKGVEIRIPVRPDARRERRSLPLFAAGPANGSAASFLSGYARALEALPRPEEPAAAWLRSRPPEERDLWTTLLPAAGAIRRDAPARAGGGRSGRLPPAGLLEETRRWSIEEALVALEGRGN